MRHDSSWNSLLYKILHQIVLPTFNAAAAWFASATRTAFAVGAITVVTAIQS